MSNTMMWSAIVGFISSIFIIPLLQQPFWSKQVRSAVTFLYAVVAGVITAMVEGGLDFANLTTSILTIFFAAIGTYVGLAKNLDITKQIEVSTSVKPPPEV